MYNFCFERWWLIIGKVLCGTSGGLVEQYFRALVAPVPQCVCGFYVTRACLLVKRLNNQLTGLHIAIVIMLHYVTLLIIFWDPVQLCIPSQPFLYFDNNQDKASCQRNISLL